MPLYKRKSFHLSDSPQDLDPNELVFQVRFTKEIFRDYQEYLNRLNLYRQRLWTCKFTGKINLTYEEALVSEHNATERVQQFPVELVPHVLNKIQYSTLNLTELVNEIHSDLQNNPYEGIELYAKNGDSLSACKIIEVMKNGEGINTRCRVGWMDKDKQVTETSVVCTKDLVRKKPPLSRSFLKAFIRESTSQSSPWLVHEKLTKKHGIPTANLKNQPDIKISRLHHHKKRKFQNGCASGSWPEEEEAVVYPIDDLLVKTSAGDPSLVDRPMPSTDFLVPMDCVGDLLMVWNFFISFGSLLQLWPFSFEDFENAICHKDSELMLMLECHSAVLRFLIKDGGDYFTAVRTKKRKLKVRLTNWAKYLCHFLEMKNKSESSDHVLTIKRGHYGLLDVRIKLSILQDLVAEVLATAAIRTSLDDCVLQNKALAARKREEARTKKKEAGDRTKKVNQELVLVNGKRSCTNLAVVNGSTPKYNNGHLRANGKIQSPHTKVVMENGESAQRVENGDEENQQREHLEREKEKLWIRSNCIGRDRNFNRYWFFRREGRLFVESLDSSSWGYYSTKEELDALMGSLNEKGERERDLKRQLEKHYAKISTGLQKKSKETAQTALLADEGELRRSARVRSQPRCSPAMMFHKYINKWKERPNANKLIRLPFSNSNAKRGHKCSSLKLLLLDSPPSPPPPPPPPS